MGEFVIAVVAAFLFFMVGLPAIGILAGIFVRAGLPYAAGYWLSFVAVWLISGGSFSWGAALTLSALWTVAVWIARRKYQEQKQVLFAWHEGHYTGALVCLLLFAPLWSQPPTGEAVVPKLEECQA
jgi:hypothetical protein